MSDPSRLPDVQSGDALSAAQENIVRRAIRSRYTTISPGTTSDSVGEATAPPPVKSRPRPSPLVAFRIVSSTQDGSNKRWTYKGRKLKKNSAGYGGWVDDPNDATEYDLFNSREDANGTTGTYGNGITQDHLDAVNDSDGGTDGTYDLVPIPEGEWPVWCSKRVVGENIEYWFDIPNGTFGACPEED